MDEASKSGVSLTCPLPCHDGVVEDDDLAFVADNGACGARLYLVVLNEIVTAFTGHVDSGYHRGFFPPLDDRVVRDAAQSRQTSVARVSPARSKARLGLRAKLISHVVIMVRSSGGGLLRR